eukprot:TRINITY_DN54412_c0_g1_i1.p1 TRINITY_DN54412_c0_g1~~TRINITY_DN54412_c0_g1_i1.p1  ORF type:complete len:532 (+),score=127.95 TRINITY_DN54412_c0_g1_i1:122-1717(+)
MTLGAAPEDDQPTNFDEVALGLQLQQFLDEWHYRVLHSGMAFKTDRVTALGSAIDLYGMHGVSLEEEKPHLQRLGEAEMVAHMSSMMPPELMKTFTHYALQLQLVVAATCRVRHALEEGDPAEVARIMDEGDAGITQQILRRAIMEAAGEVAELNDLSSSWHSNMADRVRRLSHCQEAAEEARKDLEDVNKHLAAFAGVQNSKATAVLLTMAREVDRALFSAIFKAWEAHFRTYKAEKEFRDKYTRMIEDTQQKLLTFKAGNKDGVKNLMMRKVMDGARFSQDEVLRTWCEYVRETKEERALAAKTAEAEAKISQYQEAQIANTRQFMLRMSAGSDSALRALAFQSWQKGVEALKVENAYEEKMKKSEDALAAQIAKKGAQTKQIMARMLGSGEQGLLCMVRGAWTDLWKQEMKAQELDEAVQRANEKFSNLTTKQKRVVKCVAERTNQSEEELVMLKILHDWSTQAKLERMVKHYSGKMDSKKQQLEAVQNLFKSFATQLETGVSTTPRSQRKSRGASSQPRPPAMPPAS